MALSIQVGPFTLDSTNNIVVSTITYDEGTPLQLNTLAVGRRPGAKLISAVFQPKTIKLTGVITGTSLDDVQNKLDTFKLNCIGINLNLDINDGVVNRRFIVSTTGPLSIPRQPWEVTKASWELTYQVLDPPFGIDANTGAATSNRVNALTASGLNQAAYTYNVSFSGTAPPDLKTTFTIASSGSLNAFDLVDINNGRTVTISGSWKNNDQIIIDSTNFQVTQNKVPLDYVGQFPNYQAGSNQVGINFYTLVGESLDQFQLASASSYPLLLGTNRYAQSFVPSVTASITRIALVLALVGTGQNLQLTIQSDSGGAPSGSVLTNGTMTINSASLQAIANWINITFSPSISVTGGTTYWMVLTPINNDQNNYDLLFYNYPDNYTSGKFRTSIDSGNIWQDVQSGGADWMFRIFRGTVGETNQILDYGQNTEGFLNTTYKDAAVTTANWDTVNNQLILGA